MKYNFCIFAFLSCLALLAGCASFEEAYYVDREYGMASQAAWDKQIIHTDHRYADRTPETMQGITAEELMDVHTRTYGEEPEDIEIFQLGLE